MIHAVLVSVAPRCYHPVGDRTADDVDGRHGTSASAPADDRHRPSRFGDDRWPGLDHAIVVGDVTIMPGGSLRLAGQVEGIVDVQSGGALVMLGKVKGAIVNEGGDVDVFGFVGRIEDIGSTDTMLSMGAIVGGKRVPRVMPFRRLHL